MTHDSDNDSYISDGGDAMANCPKRNTHDKEGDNKNKTRAKEEEDKKKAVSTREGEKKEADRRKTEQLKEEKSK